MASWQIPLMVEHPTMGTDPKSAAERLSLQHMAGQIAINKQVQAENALKVQAMQEDQNDQGTIQQAFHDNIGPDGTVDYDKVRATVAPKVRLRNLQALEKDHNDLVTGTVKMDADKRAKLLAQNTAIGNELVGVLQAPADQQAPSWQGSRQRLIQLGYIAPDDPDFPEQPPDAATIKAIAAKHGYAAQIQKLATDAALEESRKATAAKAQSTADRLDAEEAAKQTQRKMEDAARDHLAVTDQASHDAWLSSLDKDIARRMPKKFDPDKTPEQVQNMALTAEQRAQNADKKVRAQSDAMRAAVAGGKAGLAARAHDPTASDEDQKAAKDALDELDKRESKGLTENQKLIQADKDRTAMEAASKEFRTLRAKENDAWIKVQAYEKAASANVGDTVVDPKSQTNQTIKLDAARKQYYTDQANDLRTQAQEFNSSAKDILKQHGWGEFAHGAAQPSSPAADGMSMQSTQKKFWNLKGKTWTEGQPITGPDGKNYIVTGVNEKTGKLITQPAPPAK